jgi:integrase/recombinase XerD
MTADTRPDLHELLLSWQTALRAENKSPATIYTYSHSLTAFLAWCKREDRAAVLDRDTVRSFTASLIDSGAAPATCSLRHRALHRFGAWLAEEGEIEYNPLAGMVPPKRERVVVPKLSDDELRDLLKACQGKSLRDRRDEAIIRLAMESGARAEEICALQVDDIDLRQCRAVIRRGKGGKGRIVPFGPQTARALDRYLRLRKAHPLAGTTALWLGERGRGFGYWGMHDALKVRAEVAGIKGFHIHRLRHTAASRWLAAGGSEGGLMAVAGWSSRDMLSRYVEDTAAERAIEESRKLNLGDL